MMGSGKCFSQILEFIRACCCCIATWAWNYIFGSTSFFAESEGTFSSSFLSPVYKSIEIGGGI